MSGKGKSEIFKWDVMCEDIFYENVSTWKSPDIVFATSSGEIVCGTIHICSVLGPFSKVIKDISVSVDLTDCCTHVNVVECTIFIVGDVITRQSKLYGHNSSLIFEKVKNFRALPVNKKAIVTVEVQFKNLSKEELKNSIRDSLQCVKESKVDSVYEKLLLDESIHDIKLIVGKKQYPAHTAVLAANSPVFHRMFSHQMKETHSKEVEIKEMDTEVLEELLKYMYTRKVDKFENLASELFIAADRYEMEEFKFICERELIISLNVENVFQSIILAERHNAVELKKHGFSVVMANYAQVVEKDEFKDFANSHPNVLVELNREMAAKCNIEIKE